MITSALVGQLQTIVSRNVSPTSPIVLSITQFHSGAAYNVIPDCAKISGTIRYFDRKLSDQVSERMRALCDGFATAHGVEIDCDIRNVFDVLVNDRDLANGMIEVAADVVGAGNAEIRNTLVMGSEDFADMLQVVPGAYCTLGHGGDVPLHNPGFFIDDEILPVGASLLARMVETRSLAA